MSKIRLYGDTSGYVDLTAPDVADNSALSVGEIATVADVSNVSASLDSKADLSGATFTGNTIMDSGSLGRPLKFAVSPVWGNTTALMGSYVESAGNGIQIHGSTLNNGTSTVVKISSGTTTARYAMGFFHSATNATDGTVAGSIYFSSSGTVYSTSSDYRMKENIVPLTNALERISNLPVHRFNFINSSETVDGFLAHEAQLVVPEAVSGEKDEVDENGNPIYQGIDQSKLIPLLVAAIQEQQEQIVNLSERIQELEGKL